MKQDLMAQLISNLNLWIKTKILNEILINQELTKIKKDFAYKTNKGFFIYFIHNIFLENSYIKILLEEFYKLVTNVVK